MNLSGYGELVADTIAKGEMRKLSSLKVNQSLGVRPSRVFCDYVKKPSMNCSLSSALLDELSSDIPVVRCSYSVEFGQTLAEYLLSPDAFVCT